METHKLAALATAIACCSLAACAPQTTTEPSISSNQPTTTQSSPSPTFDNDEPSMDANVSPENTQLSTSTPNPTFTPSTGSKADNDSAPPAPGSDQTPIILDDSRSGQELGENDFPFKDPSWKGGVFFVDGAQVTGLATFLDGCSEYNAKDLQLRLGKRFRKLTFLVGQGDLSESQKDKVLVKVEANGRPITPQSVPFTTPTDFTVDVNGVNGLQMSLMLDDNVQGCGTKGKVQTVIYKIIATK